VNLVKLDCIERAVNRKSASAACNDFDHGRPVKLVVETNDAGDARAALAELVQSSHRPRDVETGESRHNSQPGPERRGARSGCNRPIAGCLFTAVNPTRLSSEAAALPAPRGCREGRVHGARRARRVDASLEEEDWLELPRRQTAARATGQWRGARAGGNRVLPATPKCSPADRTNRSSTCCSRRATRVRSQKKRPGMEGSRRGGGAVSRLQVTTKPRSLLRRNTL